MAVFFLRIMTHLCFHLTLPSKEASSLAPGVGKGTELPGPLCQDSKVAGLEENARGMDGWMDGWMDDG